MSIFMCEQSSSCYWCYEIDASTSFSTLTAFTSNGPWWWGIWCVHVLLISALCCTDPWLMIDAGSCLLHVVMIPCFMLCGIFLCDVISVITLYVMLWDPLLYVVGILLLSSCMCFSLTSLLCHVGGMRTMLVLCHTDKSLLIESSSCGTSLLEPLLREGILPCMIKTSSLCT